MSNLFALNDENEHQSVTNNFSSSGPAKKRKISMNQMSSSNIELEVLQFANEKLKEYVKKLEAERLQYIDGSSEEKIIELEDIIKKQQENIAALNAKNDNGVNGCDDKRIVELEDTVKKLQETNMENEEKHKTEMNSVIDEYDAKIKIIEAEKETSDAIIKELNDEISTMKRIKSEIKDTVESDRENVQAETDKWKAEINELKNQNQNLRACHEKEIKILKEQKEVADSKTNKYIARIKELNDEIITIKSELRKTVENNQKNFQVETEKWEAKINELKNENFFLDKNVHKFKTLLHNCQNRNKELKTQYGEAITANQLLELKINELGTAFNNYMTGFQPTNSFQIMNTQNILQTQSALNVLNAYNQNVLQPSNVAPQIPGCVSLGNRRFITRNENNGKIQIREYHHGKGGALTPGRNGISFTNDEMKVLIGKIPEITQKFLL